MLSEKLQGLLPCIAGGKGMFFGQAAVGIVILIDRVDAVGGRQGGDGRQDGVTGIRVADMLEWARKVFALQSLYYQL